MSRSEPDRCPPAQPQGHRRTAGLAATLLLALFAAWPLSAHEAVPRAGSAVAEKYFSFGDDSGEYAHDGECDDPRFKGAGMADQAYSPGTDASDCRHAYVEGRITIRDVYLPAYALGAPYDASGIEFGDNSSQWAHDGECDDPRFEGPGVAATLVEDDIEADAADCRAAFEQGKAVLRDDAGKPRMRQAVDSRSA